MNPVVVAPWRGLVSILLFLLAFPVTATEYTGKVVAVTDGDTLTILVPNGSSYQQVKIRLGEIDTPESKQPYGQRAKQQLSELIFNRPARVVVQDTDRYGRTVGRVYVGGFDINAEMVKRGAAWVYRAYAKDQSLYRLEAEAKAAKRGLWALPESQRIEPWNWRKNGGLSTGSMATLPPSVRSNQVTSPAIRHEFTCAGKRYCRQMVSCEEAQFYLQTCGVKSLDGNHDGEPCETLCASSSR